MPKYHYSSQFYYKSFACNPQRSSVCEMGRNGEINPEKQFISNICYEVDYNTKEQEEQQGRLETKYSPVLRDFIKKTYKDEYDYSEEFSEIVSFMIDNKKFIKFSWFHNWYQ